MSLGSACLVILNSKQALAVLRQTYFLPELACYGFTSSPCEPYLEISTDVCNSLIHLIAATKERPVMMTVLPNSLCKTGRRISCIVRKTLGRITFHSWAVPAKRWCLACGQWMLSHRRVEPKTPRRLYPLGVLGVCVLMSFSIRRNWDNFLFCVSSSTTLSQTGGCNTKHLYFVSKHNSLWTSVHAIYCTLR